ncbi:MAG: ferric reductase-like transmembrane domain-containing protein [Candidatus Woesearchaeota archaeon]
MNPKVSRAIIKHAIVGIISFALIFFFWYSRQDIGAEPRIWKALGDAAFIMLAYTLIIGPLAKINPKRFAKLLGWRKETGIWSAIIALSHGIAIQSLWFQFDIMKLLGYTIRNDTYILADPGMGLANLLGITALFFMTLLLATSSNYAISLLGSKAWKFLHMSAYLIFYLVAFHASYYMIIQGAWNNWFSVPFLIIALLVILLQATAFIITVKKEKQKQAS